MLYFLSTLSSPALHFSEPGLGSTRGENRTPTNGFGDRYSTIKLLSYIWGELGACCLRLGSALAPIFEN